MTDKPLPMDEAIAHYAGRLSDPMKVERLRAALSQSQKALANLIGTPDAKVGRATILTAWAACAAAEKTARQALLDTEDK